MKKITNQFGTRIQVTLDDVLYDLSSNFLYQLTHYDLHSLDYSDKYLYYIGHNETRIKYNYYVFSGNALQT